MQDCSVTRCCKPQTSFCTRQRSSRLGLINYNTSNWRGRSFVVSTGGGENIFLNQRRYCRVRRRFLVSTGRQKCRSPSAIRSHSVRTMTVSAKNSRPPRLIPHFRLNCVLMVRVTMKLFGDLRVDLNIDYAIRADLALDFGNDFRRTGLTARPPRRNRPHAAGPI